MVGYDHRGLSFGELVAQELPFEVHVQRNLDRAQDSAGAEELDRLVPVGHHRRHAIAWPHSERVEAAGQPPRALVHQTDSAPSGATVREMPVGVTLHPRAQLSRDCGKPFVRQLCLQSQLPGR